jgi:hypothetical protein
MRPKVLWSTIILAVAILAAACYLRFKPAASLPDPNAAQPAPAVASSDAAAPVAGNLPAILQRVQNRPQGDLPGAPSQADPGMDHETYVEQRKVQLEELAMNNDPQSLNIILSELQNSDADIRQQAIRSTIDFGSKDAIPTLQNDMAYTTDLHEKLAIQNAIDFLQLPRLGDDNDTASQTTDNSTTPAN